MRAMILAAGRGERLRPLTDGTPKPLLEAGGKSLIEYHLERLALAGFRQIVINLAHLGEQIRAALGDGAKWGLGIRYSEEPPGALDTGGGIRQALPLLGSAPFAVINGDIFCDYPLSRLRAVKCEQAHLVLVPNPGDKARGDFALAGGRVANRGEPLHTFSGIAVYHPDFFAGSPAGSFSVVPLLRATADARQLTGELYRGDWHDIGTPKRLEQLRRRLMDNA